MFDTILFSKDGAIATITLNRPSVRNAFNTAMRDELWEVLEAARDDTDIRCVLLSGTGPDFCAGADLTEFGTAPSVTVAREVRWERDVWGLLLGMPKPVVAALHGHCIGSGVEIALLCDIRIASNDTTFSMPETRLGLIPAAGGTQVLPRALGQGPALELLLTGRTVRAEEALDLGLVTRVVPKSELKAETLRLMRKLASLEPRAVAALKRALRHGPGLSLNQALELEKRLTLKLLTTRAF